jgi:hypothetical protein
VIDEFLRCSRLSGIALASNLVAIFFLAVFFGVGCILVIGTRQRWAWLVDPPDKMWAFYSQAFIKKIFGQTVLIYCTYVTGVLFMVLSIIFVLKELRK